MSTYWHYECLNHDPPLRSDAEFTQHTGDRHYNRGVELISQRPVEPDDGRYWRSEHGTDDERSDAYFDMNARRFLALHPKCRLRLVSEYGDTVNPEETP